MDKQDGATLKSFREASDSRLLFVYVDSTMDGFTELLFYVGLS